MTVHTMPVHTLIGQPVATSAVATLPPAQTVAGIVERLLFHDAGAPFTIAWVRAEGAERPVSVLGRFPAPRPGEHIRATGRWETHDRYGRQFRASDVTLVLPASVDAIRRYLVSPLVRGIGPVTAQHLVEHFGANTLRALDEGPAVLESVAGVGRRRAQQIAASWVEHQALRETLLTLFNFGVSYRRAELLYEQYGVQAPLVVRSDPYRLSIEVRGIGFHTADRIAAALGVPAHAPARVKAAVLHCLRAGTLAGHTWLPASKLRTDAVTLLGRRDASQEEDPSFVAPVTGPDHERRLADALVALAADGNVAAGVIGDEPAYALTAMDVLERSLAARLLRLASAAADRLERVRSWDDATWRRLFKEQAGADRLSPEQEAAIRVTLTERVAVLTGGPGTGKTTALRVLVGIAQQAGARIVLAAPTGRAARRLAEATGHEARTIHRLLSSRLHRRGTGRDDPETLELDGLVDDDVATERARPHLTRTNLAADLVVIDEASMLDLPLANLLVRAIQPGAHLLLVGDADQLPSVGPGQVLADLITSARFPVVRLDRIFRQGEGSGIAANARRINAGVMPIWEPGLGSRDFYLVNADDAAAGRRAILELVTKRIPARFGLSGSDVQVLAPMHRGALGLTVLNPELQAAINPPSPAKPELSVGIRLLRQGDRVVQAHNNYGLGVFNGDLGTIEALDPAEYLARVRLDDGREVIYGPEALPDLHLAYALSIHRAQGSEFPAIVLPVVTGHFILLSRRLLYTAVTRARRLVVLVGHSRAVSFAVRDAGAETRTTALVDRLQEPPSAAVEPSAARRRRGRPFQPSLL